MASQEDDNKFEIKTNLNKEHERAYLNVYKPYEIILKDKNEPFERKVDALISIWKDISESNFNEFQDKKHVLELIDWAKLHALYVVLTGEWTSTPDTFRDRLLQYIERAQENVANITDALSTRCQKLANVVKKPWEDPVLKKLIQSADVEIGAEEIEFFCVETAYLVSVRLKKLCENRCEDLALNLVTNFLRCKKEASVQNFNLNAADAQLWFIFDLYIALLYKFQDKKKILEQFEDLQLQEGLQLIKRFAKKKVKIWKIWRNCQKIAIFGSKFFISRALMRFSSDVKDLLADLLKTYLHISNTDPLMQEFVESVRSLTNLADVEGLCVMCDVIHQEAGADIRHFVIEMYIRVLTTDMNELERLKQANDEEKMKLTTSRLAYTFSNLTKVLDDHVKVARECALTAFSLEPTRERLKQIEEFARRSGYPVLDTGNWQEWKCRLHPPLLPSDELAWVCSECGEWMSKPELQAPMQINIPLQEALQESVLGISEALCDDLVVCLCNPRYQILSWLLPWSDLFRLCVLYLNDPMKTKNFITELKFVDVDYSIFKDIKREPIDEFTGIERGYEQYLDIDFKSDEEEEVPASLDVAGQSSETTEGILRRTYFPVSTPPTPKSDPDTLMSLRMFRPNLKRKRDDFPLFSDSKKLFNALTKALDDPQPSTSTFAASTSHYAPYVRPSGSLNYDSSYNDNGNSQIIPSPPTNSIFHSTDLSNMTSSSYVANLIKSNLTFGVPKIQTPLEEENVPFSFGLPNVTPTKYPVNKVTVNQVTDLDSLLKEVVEDMDTTDLTEAGNSEPKNVEAATLPQLGGQVALSSPNTPIQVSPPMPATPLACSTTGTAAYFCPTRTATVEDVISQNSLGETLLDMEIEEIFGEFTTLIPKTSSSDGDQSLDQLVADLEQSIQQSIEREKETTIPSSVAVSEDMFAIIIKNTTNEEQMQKTSSPVQEPITIQQFHLKELTVKLRRMNLEKLVRKPLRKYLKHIRAPSCEKVRTSLRLINQSLKRQLVILLPRCNLLKLQALMKRKSTKKPKRGGGKRKTTRKMQHAKNRVKIQRCAEQKSMKKNLHSALQNAFLGMRSRPEIMFSGGFPALLHPSAEHKHQNIMRRALMCLLMTVSHEECYSLLMRTINRSIMRRTQWPGTVLWTLKGSQNQFHSTPSVVYPYRGSHLPLEKQIHRYLHTHFYSNLMPGLHLVIPTWNNLVYYLLTQLKRKPLKTYTCHRFMTNHHGRERKLAIVRQLLNHGVIRQKWIIRKQKRSFLPKIHHPNLNLLRTTCGHIREIRAEEITERGTHECSPNLLSHTVSNKTDSIAMTDAVQSVRYLAKFLPQQMQYKKSNTLDLTTRKVDHSNAIAIDNPSELENVNMLLDCDNENNASELISASNNLNEIDDIPARINKRLTLDTKDIFKNVKTLSNDSINNTAKTTNTNTKELRVHLEKCDLSNYLPDCSKKQNNLPGKRLKFTIKQKNGMEKHIFSNISNELDVDKENKSEEKIINAKYTIVKRYYNSRKQRHDDVPCFKRDQERDYSQSTVSLKSLLALLTRPDLDLAITDPFDYQKASPLADFNIRQKFDSDPKKSEDKLCNKGSKTVPGLYDYTEIVPQNVNYVVNVVQHTISRSTAVTNQNTQTSTQVTPHIQRIGQPKVVDRKPETCENEAKQPTESSSSTSSSQPPTLINILSAPKQTNIQKVVNAPPRSSPCVNILTQQIIRPSHVSKDKPTSIATVIKEDQPKTTNSNVRILTATTQAASGVTAMNPAQGSTIVQFICKSSSLPKFQQAFGKTVYQSDGSSEGGVVSETVQSQGTTAAEPKKITAKALPINVQPITGNVIFRGQVPVGQTVSLIPPGSNTRQLFRITGSTHEQISLVKETVIQNKMSALLAAALQGKPKITEQNGELVEEYSATRITLCRPGNVPPNVARIVKPVQLQIPANVVRTPQPNVSSTTLEQLREFDMVYKQVKERSSNPAQPETTSQSSQEQQSPPQQQRISFTYVNQVQKYTQLSPVVVVTSYNSIQQSVSPSLSVTTQSGSSVPQVTTVAVPKVAVKSSKGKNIKSSTVAKTSPTMVSAIPKPQQKPQEDEYTTQRIFDILAEYAEQLRNSPDLNNKPAPRRRSNPPTNPSSNTSTSSSSKKKKKKSSTSNNSSLIETDNEDLTMGSEDSSGGNVVQLSMTDEEQSPQSASITPPESNLEPATTTTTGVATRPLVVTDSNNQTRNVIIADSSVGEALKMPNTALLMPGNYIMPVSVVKGGQQIAVVSGGSKILTTVPTRSGQNMLLLQSFVNQNKKASISTVKYSTLQPFTPTLTAVSTQSSVVLPSSSVAAVTLGQPVTLKKMDDTRKGAELLLTIAQPRETNKVAVDTVQQDVPQPDSSTTLPCEVVDIKGPQGRTSNEARENSVVTSVIASIKKREEEIEPCSSDSSTIKGDQKTTDRIGSVLVNASSSNGPMLSNMNSRYRKSSDIMESSSATKDFNPNIGKVPATATKIFKNNAVYYAVRTKKAPLKKIDSEMQKQAAIERELRLQKSLSEECEDLGVDEPSTSDLFPEADLLFVGNQSPSYEQSQKIEQTEAKPKESLHLFSDDENSEPLHGNLFDYVEYQERGNDQINGNNESTPSCDDSTLLSDCGTMSEVTLNSPEYTDPSPANKYKFKYSNRKRGERVVKVQPADIWQEITEVTSSEDTMELVKDDETPIAIQEETVIDESITDTTDTVILEEPEKVIDLCPVHASLDRGLKRSNRKSCTCFNGASLGGSRKRIQSPKSQMTAKKMVLYKKR